MKVSKFVFVALSVFAIHEAQASTYPSDVRRKGVNVKPQVQVAFEIFCEAEKRVLEERKKRERAVPAGSPPINLLNDGGTPREILKFLSNLAILDQSFLNREAEIKFYEGIEAKRTKLKEMFWSVAKEYGHTPKTLRPRLERAENDASLRGVSSPCDLSVSEKLQILSELF